MKNAVMISIQPKWCELIASGAKTIEVRKTRPQIETPFKCYIYQTQHRERNGRTYSDGKVIGEFVCKKITGTALWRLKGNTGRCAERTEFEKMVPQLACLSLDEIERYAGSETRMIYCWHISDLVIYDDPYDLNWYVVEGDCDCVNCKKCSWFNRGNGYNVEDDCDLGYESIYRKETLKPLFRPPQSWCYIYDLEAKDGDQK